MKFYYNGKLIRTSAKHNYKYACINEETGYVWGCSETKDGAMRNLNSRVSEVRQRIENCKKAIQAIKNGKDYYFCSWGRSTNKTEITRNQDYYEEIITESREWISYILNACKAVELEAR